HSTFVMVPVTFTGFVSSNSAANEWCAASWTPASSPRIPTAKPNPFSRAFVTILPFRPVRPIVPGILRVLFAGPCRLGNLLADERDLVVAQPPFVQPVGARDLLERVNGRLNAFGPGHGDELDVAVHVADGENAPTARLEVRVDADAAV